MEVSKGIQMFGDFGASGNVYLIDGEVLVDTGLEERAQKLVEQMRSEGVEISGIRVIVNTHGHFDHIGGNSLFKKLTLAKICAHKNAVRKIETGDDSCADLFDRKPALSKVNEVLAQGDEIVSAHHLFKVLHTPGHTDGSICLYEPEKKILISGDTLFADSIGRVDLPTGSLLGMRHSLRKLRKLEIKLLLPGHGPTREFWIEDLIAGILCQME